MYGADGKPELIKEPKLLLNDDNAGKAQGIHLMIGRRPRLAFGNSTGDRQMLEYANAGDGARLALLLLHDDGAREYAYGPARGLPDTKVGTFPQALDDEAQRNGWIVVSMKIGLAADLFLRRLTVPEVAEPPRQTIARLRLCVRSTSVLCLADGLACYRWKRPATRRGRQAPATRIALGRGARVPGPEPKWSAVNRRERRGGPTPTREGGRHDGRQQRPCGTRWSSPGSFSPSPSRARS